MFGPQLRDRWNRLKRVAPLVQAVSTMLALELLGLCKRFGETTAVDHLDLEVPGGSFFGLVGPNGAGKTTSLSMAVGLLRPDGGTARIFGVDVWADPVRPSGSSGSCPTGWPCRSG
jgi:ABC-2 type transport system ATP-binding protein